MARTIDKRFLGPRLTEEERRLGFWEWYAYLFEDRGKYFIGRALGDPVRNGGEAPYDEIGRVAYDSEGEARVEFNRLQSPESR